MALSIGVSVGSKIDVGGHLLQVKEIAPHNLIVISIDKGEDMVISELSRTEILPTVFVFVGVGQSGGGNRLAFEAPKTIRINRVEDTRGTPQGRPKSHENKQ